jgi:hypothetical protein
MLTKKKIIIILIIIIITFSKFDRITLLTIFAHYFYEYYFNKFRYEILMPQQPRNDIFLQENYGYFPIVLSGK